MKTVVQNFISLFRRFTTSTILNIAGLSVAFTAFLILMMQVTYDWGYDRFHKNSDRIYRVELVLEDGSVQPTLARPFVEAFLVSSPHIQYGAVVKEGNKKRNVAIEHNGERVGYEEMYEKVSSAYPLIFDFRILEGDPNTLEHPNKVLIPATMAKRLFSGTSAVGKHLVGDELQVEIGGVYQDFPQNSLVSNAIYHRIPDSEDAAQWIHHTQQAFILLDDPANQKLVLDNFERNFRPAEYTYKGNKLRLTHLPEVYFLTDTHFEEDTTKGSKAQIFVLFGIALLIVGIAAINFTNFSNSLVPIRLKSVNTQKVLGCSIRTLRLSMVIEAIALSLISFVIALLAVLLLSETGLKEIVSGGIQLSGHLSLLIYTGLFAVGIGLFAGLWPAYYITSFPPALVLKGNFGLSSKGKGLRNVLVGAQFTASFVLIIGAVFINFQNRYMARSSIGFDKDQVAIVKLNSKLTTNPALLARELKKISGIEEVATVDQIFGGGDNYITRGGMYQGKQIAFNIINADPTILDVLGIDVTEGRNFLPEDRSGDGAFIFNEKARREFDLDLAHTIDLDLPQVRSREKIVGFVDDVKYNSYRSDLGPFAFSVKSPDNSRNRRQYAMLRIAAGSNYYQLRDKVSQSLLQIDPDYPFQMNLYNEVLDNLYLREITLGRQVTFFSLIAILISLIGVFGTVLFESAYKRREIAVRKVFGSSVREILLLLSNRYIQVLTICFILAIPIAWYVVTNWLQNFAYKTPMYWWVFILSFITVTLITLFTVTIQNWRAAMVNPVDSLKTE